VPSREPIALLLLPRRLEGFILEDLARDLLRAPRVLAAGPGRVPYGSYGRLPGAIAERVATQHAQRLAARLPGPVGVVLIFHPLQVFVAEALLRANPGAELWYSRWDRYENAYDASPRLRARLAELHERAAGQASLTLAVSGALAEQEERAGRTAALAPPPHDSFPAPAPEGAVVAVSLGHLGWRTDWALLRELGERMPELVLLLIGEWHEDESGEEADFRACRALPNFVWLGRQPDEQAARLVLCADVGIVPFRQEEFNDAALPQRIVKYARLGRRTIAPDLAGVRTWDRAVTVARTPEEWMSALRDSAGRRAGVDEDLRDWALAQTAERQNAPLWERLGALGVVEQS
jgi:glycosyltransferase involved in cell wall biosynthesis